MAEIYLICGNEEYLKKQNLEKLLKELPKPGSMNYRCFEGSDFDLTEAASVAETLPFMEEKRTVLFRNTGFLKEQAPDGMMKLLEELPETTAVIFLENETDAKRTLYKYVQKNGKIIRCDSVEKKIKSKDYKGADQDRAMIRSWAEDYIRKAGCRADRGVIEELLQMTGFDMLNLSTELEKLVCYRAGENISAEDIRALSSRTVQDQVFELLRECFAGNYPRAVAMFEEMLAIRVAPMLVLRLLQKQAEQVFVICELLYAGCSQPALCEKTGLADWQVRKLLEPARAMRPSEAKSFFEATVVMEQRIKEGNMPEQIGVEILLTGGYK